MQEPGGSRSGEGREGEQGAGVSPTTPLGATFPIPAGPMPHQRGSSNQKNLVRTALKEWQHAQKRTGKKRAGPSTGSQSLLRTRYLAPLPSDSFSFPPRALTSVAEASWGICQTHQFLPWGLSPLHQAEPGHHISAARPCLREQRKPEEGETKRGQIVSQGQ